MLYRHWSEVPARIWTYQNFTPYELSSNGDGSILVNHDALAKLQRLREKVGPLIINSAYRDPIYNARIGGAPRSMHKEGRAFDISLRNHDRTELLQAALSVGFAGVGKYQTFLHVDTGPRRSWGKWE